VQATRYGGTLHRRRITTTVQQNDYRFARIGIETAGQLHRDVGSRRAKDASQVPGMPIGIMTLRDCNRPALQGIHEDAHSLEGDRCTTNDHD
jgi:hypothetical protein